MQYTFERNLLDMQYVFDRYLLSIQNMLYSYWLDLPYMFCRYLLDVQKRMKIGLKNIINTQEHVDGMKKELTALEPELKRQNQSVQILVEKLIIDQKEAYEVSQYCFDFLPLSSSFIYIIK